MRSCVPSAITLSASSPRPGRNGDQPHYLEVVAAVPPGVDVIVSNHPERWAAMLGPLQPDLIISGGFPWRIPADVLARPRLGAINFHDALLPRHRGPNATGWAFRADDAETGLTVHRMTPEFDASPILAQARVPITDDDDWLRCSPVRDHAPDSSGRRWTACHGATGRSARREPGDRGRAVRARVAGHRLEQIRADDSQSGAQLDRAAHIPPGALGEIDGETLQITQTRLLPVPPGSRRAAPPGTVSGGRATNSWFNAATDRSRFYLRRPVTLWWMRSLPRERRTSKP